MAEDHQKRFEVLLGVVTDEAGRLVRWVEKTEEATLQIDMGRTKY